MSGPGTARGRKDLDTFWIFLLTFLLCAVLAQDVFFKADGPHLVSRLVRGDSHYPHHRFYMPLLIGFGELLGTLGVGPYRSAVYFSVTGVAVGVACGHAGFRLLGTGRRAALLAALFVAFSPPVLFFGTVVEFHGPFLGFAGLAFLGMALLHAHLDRRPALALAVLLGALTALASGVHASGLVLPAVLLPNLLATAERRCRWRRALRLAILAGGVHVALSFLLADPLRSGHFLEKGFGHPRGAVHLPRVLLQEWLVPFLPLSIACLAALFRPALRLEAFALLLALVPYLLGALRLLVGEVELGAYFLPLAFPAARLAVLSLPRPGTLLALGLSLFLSVVLVRYHELSQIDRYRSYASGLQEATGSRRVLLLLGEAEELGPCHVYLPETEFFLLDSIASLPVEIARAELTKLVDVVNLNRSRGREVYLTEGGERFLSAEHPLLPSGPLMLAHIREHFVLVPVEAPGFRARRLTPRQ